jgi:hypothetical protein
MYVCMSASMKNELQFAQRFDACKDTPNFVSKVDAYDNFCCYWRSSASRHLYVLAELYQRYVHSQSGQKKPHSACVPCMKVVCTTWLGSDMHARWTQKVFLSLPLSLWFLGKLFCLGILLPETCFCMVRMSRVYVPFCDTSWLEWVLGRDGNGLCPAWRDVQIVSR